MQLSIIIPAHNEEGRIGKTLLDYLSYFREGTEILVILNGCTDNTQQVVREIQSRFPKNLKIENLKEGSKGLAVRRGFETAQGDIIGFVDADEATSPQEFAKLINEIGGFDGIIASRSLKGSRAEKSFLRKIISFAFFLIVKMLFNLPYRDTQCGAKIFKREAIKKILPEMQISNMIFDVELLLLLNKYGFRIKEVPTVWFEKGSSDTFKSPFRLFMIGIRMFITLLQLRIRLKYEKRKTHLR